MLNIVPVCPKSFFSFLSSYVSGVISGVNVDQRRPIVVHHILFISAGPRSSIEHIHQEIARGVLRCTVT